MKIQAVINYLDEIYKPQLQETYDNAGHTVGDANNTITGVLVVLDVTPEVVDEAIEYGCNLIVSHHPMIFRGLKRIVPDNVQCQMLEKLIKKDICLYAAHTNLDNLITGVNGILAEKLKIRNPQIIKSVCDDDAVGAGIIGTLEKAIPTYSYMATIKETLGLPLLRSSKIVKDNVQRIAICGGAGSFLIDDAIANEADIYLTADLKYHDFQRADARIILADIGHYESEQFAQELIYNDIIKKFSTFATRISKVNTNYIYYI